MFKKYSTLALVAGLSMMAEAEATTGAATAEPAVPAGSKKFPFHFRTEKIRDEQGNVIGEGKKLPTFNAILPFPSDAELVDFIAANGKEAELLRDAVYIAMERAARGQINDYREANPDKEVTADSLDLSKLTFTAIANTPAKDRAQPEIPEEQYNSFFEDYKTVMVASGKEPQRVAKHIVLYKNQFRTCKFDKQALTVLRDSLNLWAAKTENMEDNKDVYEALVNKADKYLKAEEKNLVNAL